MTFNKKTHGIETKEPSYYIFCDCDCTPKRIVILCHGIIAYCTSCGQKYLLHGAKLQKVHGNSTKTVTMKLHVPEYLKAEYR